MTPPPSITCPRCGFTSYNPHDIAERYCGHCHAFHDDPVVSVREATSDEQRAALVAHARLMVADGYGHECDEWRDATGACELCGSGRPFRVRL